MINTNKFLSFFVLPITLVACGGGEIQTDASFLSALGTGAAPTSLPTGLASSSQGLELVTNGTFTDGTNGWRLSSLSKSALGNQDPFLVTQPPEANDQIFAEGNSARLCGYPTRVGSVKSNCVDILISTDDAPLVVPNDATSLEVSVIAYGKYGCPGFATGHGAFVFALKPLDGLPNTSPASFQAKEEHLPDATWRELKLVINSTPELNLKDRRFKLMLNFSTLASCEAPADQDTYVLVSSVSVKAR
jgi:hypothetical protein